MDNDEFLTIRFPDFWMFKNEGGWRWVANNTSQSSAAAFDFAPQCMLDARRCIDKKAAAKAAK